MSESHPNDQVTQAQKAGVVLLSLFAVLVLVLGFLQFRSTIYGPFVTVRNTDDTDTADVARLLADDEVRLQRIDTDQDGLTDFEELTFYGTSPYIPDTDSDGIDDMTEVKNETDPNCPEGEDCGVFSAELGNGTDSTFENPLFEAYDDPLDALGAELNPSPTSTPSISDLTTEDQLSVLSIASDPDALRELLKTNTELSDAEIDNLSDDFLLEIAADILAE